ncbi:glucose-6-phosphate isomerase [Vitreimonas sp.]|uniref:glucose-6-phosphate isomerase n=1 Tax=Vitreimonas sp. TaxID=3069702 RepID=UPI002ED782FD
MRDAWSKVEAEAKRLAPTPLLDLFAANPRRADELTVQAPHLIADFSKQRIDGGALNALGALAHAVDFDGWRARLFAGEAVNNTEGRAAKHWALRGADSPAAVMEVRARIAAFAEHIRPQINAIVHLGIGGSDLGPRLVLDALKPLRVSGIDVRFAANVDGADVADAIDGLDPKRTLLIVVSKTFTTQETLANAEFVRAWGPAHVAAATAAPDKAAAWGVPAENVFAFWDWVGGRYSLWSSVSLACAIALQDGAFENLLSGAAAMDAHFRDAPFAQNLPALSAAVQMWNREALGHGSYALIPYSERLRLMPAYMQQLEMESNGKRVSRDGVSLDRSACGVTWGAAGTNAQHSFFQLLHQGVGEIPVEFIVNAGRHEGPASHRAKVFANALAQTRALMVGKSAAQARAEMVAKGMSEAEADRLAPHRAFPGDRASTLMAIDSLSPEAIGALLAFYEHRTFAQAVLAGINPFDQWGVELGKEMANALLPSLEGGAVSADLDASTAAWVKRLG